MDEVIIFKILLILLLTMCLDFFVYPAAEGEKYMDRSPPVIFVLTFGYFSAFLLIIKHGFLE